MSGPAPNRRQGGPWRVNVVLPPPFEHPIGGYKVHYEYANRLAALGHRVVVVHPWEDPGRCHRLRRWPLEYARCALGRAGVAPWFDFHPSVRTVLVPRLSGWLLPRADLTVLTSWETSRDVAPTPLTGRLVQIVYDYEFWCTAPPRQKAEMAGALARSDVFHVAGSSAVAEMLAEAGVRADAVVTCGLDHGKLPLLTEPGGRPPLVGFPLRAGVHKGGADMASAAGIVAAARPGTRFACFGEAWDVDLPAEVDARGRVSDAELARFYNECSVFVLPSRHEGWGLPAAEAMACGAAVVATDNGGSRDFALDGETALVVPPADPGAIAAAVVRLLDDPGLRLRLARNGQRAARQMSWDRSTQALVSALGEALS